LGGLTKVASPAIGKIIVNDQEIDILEGDTLGACMMRAGVLATRRSRSGQLRGLYCAIGVCNDCLVSVNGIGNVRACMTAAEPGARVDTVRDRT
jgi:predicted molibdopterin-dependent oxidoreductase YjgC